MIKRFFLLILCLVGLNLTFSIDLDTFDKLSYKLQVNLNKINKNKLNKILKIWDKIRFLKCEYWIFWNVVKITPSCFIRGEFPIIDFKLVVDDFWPYVKDFYPFYDLKATNFIYTWAKVKFIDFPTTYQIFDRLYDQKFSTWDKIIFVLVQLADEKIEIPKIYFERKQFEKYSFYVSTKDLSNRWKCRKFNYKLAIRQLDWLYLYPNQKFNFNKKLASLPNNFYCREKENKYTRFMFYEGVCWASSQLFRNALINPFLEITKRFNHLKRYVYFYSDYIYWDDASMYQMTKQFEIKNIWSYPIYFKIFDKWSSRYLISIYPAKTNYKTIVLKKQIWRLKAVVWKQVFKSDWQEWYSQIWISNYCCRDYSR